MRTQRSRFMASLVWFTPINMYFDVILVHILSFIHRSEQKSGSNENTGS